MSHGNLFSGFEAGSNVAVTQRAWRGAELGPEWANKCFRKESPQQASGWI